MRDDIAGTVCEVCELVIEHERVTYQEYDRWNDMIPETHDCIAAQTDVIRKLCALLDIDPKTSGVTP